MGTRDDLIEQMELTEDEVDDIIGRAALLQDNALNSEDDQLDLDTLKASAQELDIDPIYVEEAMTQLTQERVADEQARAQRTRRLLFLGVAIVGVLAVTGVSYTLYTASITAIADRQEIHLQTEGASALLTAKKTTDLAETRLVAVLDRQTSLAPQLVVLAGGELTEMSEALKIASEAHTLVDRLTASTDLGIAMGMAFAQLPATNDANAQQTRLNLQYEITGIQNRITTEKRRYDVALLQWQQVAQTDAGKAGIQLDRSLAPKPQGP